jgi:hypothetical protein
MKNLSLFVHIFLSFVIGSVIQSTPTTTDQQSALLLATRKSCPQKPILLENTQKFFQSQVALKNAKIENSLRLSHRIGLKMIH